MIRDPFYLEIIERLDKPLHEEAFERASQDLLQQIYPSLVPIRGGNDAGADGRTADFDGNPIALVATAGAQVRRNVKTNIKSALKDRQPYRRIVIATPKKLTRRQQDGLRTEASKWGFHIGQIYEQAGMAQLLYRRPEWCKELLNLAGDPPALSIVSRSSRPNLTSSLVGRAEDAWWLKTTKNDRLLVGQPGSGKTFLLSELAKKDGWLFVVNSDLTQIANAIRSQEPTALIIDDAHLDDAFLTKLKHLRTQIHFDLPLVVTCWPGAQDRIIDLLNLTRKQIRELEPLSRPEIAEILNVTGLRGSDSLIYQILNQSDGRPGLAITLAFACIAGDERDLEEVFRGDVLVRSIRGSFESLIRHPVIDILGVFAVGGQGGMNIQHVADYLEKSVSDIRLVVTGLSAGGVVNEVNKHFLSVRPLELGYALTRDVFFHGAPSLNIEPLLGMVPYRSEATRVLVKACHYGADVPDDLLLGLLEESNAESLWEEYAWLGPAQSRLVLREHPDLVVQLVGPTLFHAPDVALPLLFERARTRSIDHIETWIKEGLPGSGDPIRRRKALLNAAQSQVGLGKCDDVTLQALSLVISPQFTDHLTDPVIGNRVTRRWGLLSRDELHETALLWPQVFALLKSFDDPTWKYVLEVISDWVFPQRVGHANEDVRKQMHCTATQILTDLIQLACSSAGIVHRANEYAAEMGVTLPSVRDEEFETLFPSISDNWREFAKWQEIAIKTLAERWSRARPSEVIERILQIERQAKKIGETNRHVPWLAWSIAAQVSNPIEWIEAFVTAKIGGDLVQPFFSKAVDLGDTRWEEIAKMCLKEEFYRFGVATAVLIMADPPDRVLTIVLESLSGMSKQIEALCCRKTVSERVIPLLLSHEDDSIASNTATGIWQSDPTHLIPVSMYEKWRTAVLRGKPNDYWISQILKINPDLAFAFLQKECKSKLWRSVHRELAPREAISALSIEQRLQLLRDLVDTPRPSDWVSMVVGDNVQLFRELISIKRLGEYHLDPLRGMPKNWLELARIALENNALPKRVAAALCSPMVNSWPDGTNQWSKWQVEFSQLTGHESELVRELAKEGIEIVRKNQESSTKKSVHR